jgi:hypothetical protein
MADARWRGVIGRIFKATTSPVGTPWMWTLAYRDHEDADARLRTDARGRDGGVSDFLCEQSVVFLAVWAVFF